MNSVYFFLLLVFAVFSLLIFVKGWIETTINKNAFGETPWLFWLGIFVWGDAVIFGLFWFAAAAITWLLKDWLLFLLICSIFWVVRSAGESIYWLNQQFSTLNRNPPAKMRGYRFFHNDSIWFIYQIFWQSITMISLISTLWLSRIFFS